MSKERTITCQHYEHEGSCSLGREAEFWKYCQRCPDYLPIKNGRAARKNLKKEKQIEAQKRDLREMRWD